MRRFLSGIIFITTCISSTHAQNTSTNESSVEKFSIQALHSTFTSEKEITAIAIRSSNQGEFFIVMDSIRISVPLEPDAPEYTYFLSVSPTKTISIISSNTDFEVSLIKSGIPPKMESSNARTLSSDPCSGKLTIVLQEDWRSGLPEPNYSRSFHQVNHLIVHHSAGSNTNTDFLQVVRDIYLLHTEVNGWSDIGYNYLIAQDGTLFAGRDPGTGSQSRVRGAHFCGKNSGTLGVCLLGNYETAQVPNQGLITLEGLLSYEVLLQELDPLGSRTHSGQNLEVISGHRDGCSTLCPGENLYLLLPEIRQVVDRGCNPVVGNLEFSADDQIVEQGTVVTFYNQSTDFDRYRWNFEAGFPSVSFESDSVQVTYFDEGLYMVELIGYNEDNESSLKEESFIEVTPGPNSPLVYPNPINQNEPFMVDYHATIQTIRLYHPTGYSYGVLNPGEPLPGYITPGFYILEIKTTSGIFIKKLLVK